MKWPRLKSFTLKSPPDEDFAKLAQEYSEGAGRAAGGDIGWVNRGTLIPGIEQVAFEKLSVGQVSEPFRTSMGIHIRLTRRAGKRQGVAAGNGGAQDQGRAAQQKPLRSRFKKWVKTDLRRKNRVDVKMAGVVFEAEDSKEGTVIALMANSTRSARRSRAELYAADLNPLSYIVKEIPI